MVDPLPADVLEQLRGLDLSRVAVSAALDPDTGELRPVGHLWQKFLEKEADRLLDAALVCFGQQDQVPPSKHYQVLHARDFPEMVRTLYHATALRRPVSLGKISPPRLSAVYNRERLFKRLDASRTRSALWLTGPPGAGKTTLIASYIAARQLSALWYQADEGDNDPSTFFYFLRLAAEALLAQASACLPLLTPEYLVSITGFTRRFFRSLFDRLSHPAVLVIDNYQELPQESPLHGILRIALDEVPQDCCVIIISRRPLPDTFTRLQANDRLAVIGWDETSLRDDEAIQIALLRNAQIQPNDLQKLVFRCQRWTAGLVLLLEWMKRESLDSEGISVSVPDSLFSYFACEVAKDLAPEAEYFLLQVALLPRTTGSMAAALTDQPNAEFILSELVRRNNFVTRHIGRQTVYQFHPLFRDYLLETASRRLSREAWIALKRRAAEILQEAGELEASIKLWKELEDWPHVAETISQAAEPLLTHGRNRTVVRLLESIPRAAEEHWPSLVYWRSMGLMHLDPLAALRMFEIAYNTSKKNGQVQLLYSAWCGIVESYWFLRDEVHTLKAWLDELRQVRADFPYPSSPEHTSRIAIDKYCAMALCSLADPTIEEAEKRVLRLLHEDIAEPQRLMGTTALMLRNTWFGGCREAARSALYAVQALLQKDGPSFAGIMASFCTCLYHYSFSGPKEACLEAASAGFRQAEELGVAVLDSMFVALIIHLFLSEEQPVQANEYLQLKVWNTSRRYDFRPLDMVPITQ